MAVLLVAAFMTVFVKHMDTIDRSIDWGIYIDDRVCWTTNALQAAARLSKVLEAAHEFDVLTGSQWNASKGTLFASGVATREELAGTQAAQLLARPTDGEEPQVGTTFTNLGIDYDLETPTAMLREKAMKKVPLQCARIRLCCRGWSAKRRRCRLVKTLICPKIRWAAL